ncbi:MAG: X-Pro dipeptidyl-peptidase [Frankiaceae bacterium]|nr:X-Pro dipeptidyl-peptidase [Frankiaceae bacterium]
MRSRILLIAAALAGAVVAVPASGAPAGKIDGSVTRSYVVPTRDAEIYLEVVEPTSGGHVVPAPVILTYSPYSVLGRNGDADHWVPRGFARAYADVIGTGNSGGCYDYGGNREKRTGHDVVEWIARQRWTTGKIGMLGGSYDGTTQYATAVTHPRGLVTIVPEAAISRWYDYAYAGGIRYTDTDEDLGNEGPGAAGDEGVDTPLGFDFGFAIPPPTDVSDPDWRERVASTVVPCDELTHTGAAYNLTPDYDGFWMDRDYVHLLPTVRIPVLVAGNWGDWNVKQKNGWDAYHALTHSVCRKMYFGTRWEGHGVPPGAGYAQAVDRWFAHWLQGVDNGVQRMPDVTSQTSDNAGPIRYLAGREPVRSPLRLYLGADKNGAWALSPHVLHGSAAATFTQTGTNTEARAAAQPFAGGSYLAFASPVLTRDVRLFGRPVLHLWSTVQRRWVTITPSLLDYDPSKFTGSGAAATAHVPSAVVAMTRGWLDSRYRHGLDHEVPSRPGESTRIRVPLFPTDYTVRKGHQLVLVVQTEDLDWAVAKPYPNPADPTVRIDWSKGQSWLQLPVVRA